MKDFWKDELELFKKDVENIWNFMFQPVTFGKKEEILSLKPDEDEIISKATSIANNDENVTEMDKASESFWSREFDLLKKDIENAWDFLFQPVVIGKKKD